MTTPAELQTPTTEDLHPGIYIPSLGPALELAAARIQDEEGHDAHERFWNSAADPAGREELAQDYRQAVADHIAHWGAQANPSVAERLALMFMARTPAPDDGPPPGWHWPVCDDCLDPAYDRGITGAVAQAAFMQEFGAELPDHLCEMALSPEDRDRDSCDCGCQADKILTKDQTVAC